MYETEQIADAKTGYLHVLTFLCRGFPVFILTIYDLGREASSKSHGSKGYWSGTEP